MEKVLKEALTFDDVLVLPMHSEVLPKEVSLQTKFTKNISINMPFCSAAMDTVTESKMAIAVASLGGIGIIHKNNSPEEQAIQVRQVKKFESGIVRDPISIKSTNTIEELKQLTSELIKDNTAILACKVMGAYFNRRCNFKLASIVVRPYIRGDPLHVPRRS